MKDSSKRNVYTVFNLYAYLLNSMCLCSENFDKADFLCIQMQVLNLVYTKNKGFDKSFIQMYNCINILIFVCVQSQDFDTILAVGIKIFTESVFSRCTSV